MLDSPKSELRLNVEEEPKLGRRPLSLPPLETALYSSGLVDGENDAPDESLRPERPALPDRGDDAPLLAGVAVLEAESRYLGGVMYVVPGVSGGVADGSSPRRERCVGVRGISERSSFGRNKGYNATRMFNARMNCTICSARSG